MSRPPPSQAGSIVLKRLIICLRRLGKRRCNRLGSDDLGEEMGHLGDVSYLFRFGARDKRRHTPPRCP